ncbi:hypothetical protein RB199_23895 [Streptomyces libani]
MDEHRIGERGNRCLAQFSQRFVQVDAPGDPLRRGFEEPEPVGLRLGDAFRLVPGPVRSTLGGRCGAGGAGARQGRALP